MKEKLTKYKKKILILAIGIISFVSIVFGGNVVKAYTTELYDKVNIYIHMSANLSNDGEVKADSIMLANVSASNKLHFFDTTIFNTYKIDLPAGYTWGYRTRLEELFFYGGEYTFGELEDLGFLKQSYGGGYDLILYIIRMPAKYTVNYNANGGSGSMSSSSHVYDSWANLNANTFTRKGYTFQGWSTSATATTATYGDMASVANLTTTHGGSVTLYAVWKPNTYTVSFSGNGGSVSSSSKNVTYNSTYGTLPTATRKGYTFKGWYTATSGGTKITSGSTVSITAKQTLYAQWTHNKYTVTYDSNGGNTANITKNYYYNNAVDLSPVAQKDGKIFVGWSTSKNAKKPMSSYTMPDLATSTNSAHKDWELTLYAVYSIPVSDVENHTYPEYSGTSTIKDDEVYFLVWKEGNTSVFRTYPLTYKKDINTMVYRYTLGSTNISSFVGSSAYCYQVIAYDNAGNYSVLYQGSSDGSVVPDFPMPEKYLQTVKHYIYDVENEDWVQFDVTTEVVLEGMTYTPSYITPPEGYKASSIDGAYVVTEEKINSAYYMPIEYILFFDANGGSCDIDKKIISYGDIYGDLPTPRKTGYQFTGWNTKADGSGEKITRNKQYQIAGNSTIYAQWKAETFGVTYDYWTNGGTSSDKPSEKVEYGQAIDLSVKAYKDGWEFVGWNTDSTAITGIDSMKIPAEDVTLYAVYKKDITLTIVEQADDGQDIRNETKTIYNTTPTAVFSMTAEPKWTDWTFLGWTDGTSATDAPIVGLGTKYELSESGTLYGLYTSTVTLSYDTNGSSMVIDQQTKERYYNASGDSANPEYTIEDAPVLSHHSFVSWTDSDGNEYMPGENHSFDKDTILTSKWDKHPEIEAYDRYFTLEQAQSGDITEEELLKKVVVTDLEDGTMVNGVDVIVKDYNSQEFTSLESDKEIEIIYQATDSFGNVVAETIMVRVTDTTLKRVTTRNYVRFISKRFLIDGEGDLVASRDGGLEETSIWRTDVSRLEFLMKVVQKDNDEVETWTFKLEDIKKIKCSK